MTIKRVEAACLCSFNNKSQYILYSKMNQRNAIKICIRKPFDIDSAETFSICSPFSDTQPLYFSSVRPFFPPVMMYGWLCSNSQLLKTVYVSRKLSKNCTYWQSRLVSQMKMGKTEPKHLVDPRSKGIKPEEPFPSSTPRLHILEVTGKTAWGRNIKSWHSSGHLCELWACYYNGSLLWNI